MVSLKVFVIPVLLVSLSLFLAGCTFQQANATPTPTEIPTQQASVEISSPSPELSSSPVPSPSPSPSSGSQSGSLRDLTQSVRSVLFGVFKRDIEFSENKDPINGEVSFEGGQSNASFTVQARVYKSISIQWPPNVNLINITGSSGKVKTIRFTQPNLHQVNIDFSYDMECNGFTQMISVSGFEVNTTVLPFQNLAKKSAEALVAVCP